MANKDPISRIRWRKENLKTISFVLNIKDDADIIAFLENNKATYGTSNIIREGLRMVMKSRKSEEAVYYRTYYYNGDKAEFFNADFKRIATVDVFIDTYGEVLLKATRLPINLTRVIKRSDTLSAFLETEPIEGTDEYLKVTGSMEMTNEQREKFTKNATRRMK